MCSPGRLCPDCGSCFPGSRASAKGTKRGLKPGLEIIKPCHISVPHGGNFCLFSVSPWEALHHARLSCGRQSTVQVDPSQHATSPQHTGCTTQQLLHPNNINQWKQPLTYSAQRCAVASQWLQQRPQLLLVLLTGQSAAASGVRRPSAQQAQALSHDSAAVRQRHLT